MAGPGTTSHLLTLSSVRKLVMILIPSLKHGDLLLLRDTSFRISTYKARITGASLAAPRTRHLEVSPPELCDSWKIFKAAQRTI